MADNSTSPAEALALLNEAFAYFDVRDLAPQAEAEDAADCDEFGLAA